MSEAQVHFVVFHRPGAVWQMGVDFREQPGVIEHVAYYAKLQAEGKLAMGGPYLTPDRGGMMVATSEVSERELRDFAAADPAVQSGLLEFEVLAWYVPMKAEGGDG